MESRNLHKYEIRVEGKLSNNWSDWFEAPVILYDEQAEQTVLVGRVIDQGALYGLLNKLRDLGLQLVSLRRIDDETTKPMLLD